ncbi:hypothetical protein GCM10011579_060580 [Streptomyces albiflavescens]|uniref:Uncharacterized protein n=1 Tax=Streptomyces albiflavescens TaxID=1623582 RepID=A0A918D7L6_9ACTN|nr:hypothetical protein [Streptomyces albiflavescens]GGN77911.1 hypothetical protein GCM10011579_060580 [Streptomyces albiflavescens]
MSGAHGPIGDTARRALEQELADLRAERDTVAATLKDPEEVGDHADQADELQRAGQLQRLDDQIDEISSRLREASDAGAPRTDQVGVGSTVTVRFSVGELPDGR